MAAKMRVGLLLVAGGSVWGCVSHDPSSPSPHMRTVLPDIVGSGQYASTNPPTELDLCAWVMAADRVVWSEVVDLELLSHPLVQGIGDDPGWRTIDPSDCRDAIPALRMSIRVLQNLFGEGDDEVDVHFGARHVHLFTPQPWWDEAGNVVWTPPNGGLYPGDQVGVVVRFVEKAGVWSAMGEPMFAVDDEGRLYAQDLMRTTGQFLVPPLEEKTLEELAVAIDSCGDGDASAIQARQDRVAAIWGLESSPAHWGAAKCSHGQSSPDPGQSSPDPGSGNPGYEACVEGKEEECASNGGDEGTACRADGPHCADGLQCVMPDGESEGVCQRP